MKVIAMYLPQFHRVKENDEWWGEGFTEWTTVSKAKPLFQNHEQPLVPLNSNYYDLLQHETIQWQAKLMSQYGIDAMCFYHYWFRNGRKILEKPAENLLKWKDIDMPFCFSWANETWARTWSNLTGFNNWASEYETNSEANENGILLDQQYGDKTEWEIHFNYLIDFFRDDRYIKIDGKPVFVFYKSRDIHCLENMIEYWNDLAKENGFEGIYTIGNNPRQSQCEALNKVMMSEPGYSMQRCKSVLKNGVTCYDYDEVWNNIIHEEANNTVIGGFVSYDDTPRHGSKGVVIENATPSKFERYMTILMERNQKMGNEFVFVNAWNEWGEGMKLEPDQKCKYKYLNAIKNAKKNLQKGRYREDKAQSLAPILNLDYDKEKHFRIILDRWLEFQESDVSIIKLLNGYLDGTFAIYGYGILGKHLMKELSEVSLRPEFVVDRSHQKAKGIKLLNLSEPWPEVDVMIVTATYDYGTVYSFIKSKNRNINVVSLEHIILDYREER